MRIDMQEARRAHTENSRPSLIAKGWYTARVVDTEEVVSQAPKLTKGFAVTLRFQDAEGRPVRRIFKLWHTRKDGTTVQAGARAVYALALATNAIEADEEISEGLMCGQTIEVKLGHSKPNPPDYPDPRAQLDDARAKGPEVLPVVFVQASVSEQPAAPASVSEQHNPAPAAGLPPVVAQPAVAVEDIPF